MYASAKKLASPIHVHFENNTASPAHAKLNFKNPKSIQYLYCIKKNTENRMIARTGIARDHERADSFTCLFLKLFSCLEPLAT